MADRALKRPFEWSLQVGATVCKEARKRGVIARSLGDVLVIMPPLSITIVQLDTLLDVLRDCARIVTEGEGDA